MAGQERRQSTAEIAAALVTTLIMVWSVLPDHEKTHLRLRLLHAGRVAAGRLARRSGHLGMGDEISGRDFGRYQVAYWLSRGRDALAGAIEGMRP